MFWFLILIVPGLIAAYALLLRPFLQKIPGFATFYAEANGFWAKVWALCGNSVTVLWGYVLGGIGAAFTFADQIAAAAGDPALNLTQKVTDAFKDHPSLVGYILTGISVLTIVARIRSIGKA